MNRECGHCVGQANKECISSVIDCGDLKIRTDDVVCSADLEIRTGTVVGSVDLEIRNSTVAGTVWSTELSSGFTVSQLSSGFPLWRGSLGDFGSGKPIE